MIYLLFLRYLSVVETWVENMTFTVWKDAAFVLVVFTPDTVYAPMGKVDRGEGLLFSQKVKVHFR